MPSRKFALTPGGPKRLTIAWKLFSNKREIWLDGKTIGEIPDRKTLKKGRAFRLPDGSKLTVRQTQKLGIDELQVLRNGVPLPDSDTDPERRVRVAYQIIFFLGGINLAYGIFLLLTGGTYTGGPELVATGLIYLALGFFVRRHSMVAMVLTILGFITDTLLLVWLILNGGGLAFGAIFLRIFVVLYLLRGFVGLRQLNRVAEATQPKQTESRHQSFLETDDKPAPQKGILEDFSRLELALLVTVALLIVLVIGVLVGMLITGRIDQPGQPTAIAAAPFRNTLPPAWTPTPTQTSTPLPPSPIIGLPFRVIAAEYSNSLERIVMVSGAPNQVHIYNPATQTDQVVPLSGTPENISLSPDGKYAAVGQGNTIDYIDLQNAASLKTLSVRYPVDDILLAGNGWIYTAADESPNSHLVAVEIDTNQEIFADVGFRIRSLQLSADGHSLYSVGYELYTFARTDINALPLGVTHSISYLQRRYPAACTDIFLSRDGLRMFTTCGDVLRNSTVSADDMQANGSLEGFDDTNRIRHMIHVPAAGILLALPGKAPFAEGYPEYNSEEVVKFQYDPIARLESWMLPNFVVNGQRYAAYGRFIFANTAGTEYYVIVQADRSAGVLNDYGLLIGHLDEQSGFVAPLAANITTPEFVPQATSAADVPALPPTFTPAGIAVQPTSLPTIPRPEIPLSAKLKRVIFDDAANMAYGLDAENRKLWVIDLTAKKEVSSFDLVATPSDGCIIPSRHTLYIANWGNTVITEFDLTTHTQQNRITWPAAEVASQRGLVWDYDIYCQPDRLILLDATFGPKPWVIDLNNPLLSAKAIQTGRVLIGSTSHEQGIGDLVFTADENEFYYWFQAGWDAGWAGSEVLHARLEGDQFVNLEQAGLQYPQLERDPFDTPIFLDVATGRLITKQILINIQTLSKVEFVFDRGQNIYAVDWGRNLAASKQSIYDLNTFRVVGQVPSTSADQLHFAADGTLYVLSNADGVLYYVTPTS